MYIQYRSIITSFFHTWGHTVFRVESSIITRGNKILHIMRRGISCNIYTWVYTARVISMPQLLAMEASYTIHENNY